MSSHSTSARRPFTGDRQGSALLASLAVVISVGALTAVSLQLQSSNLSRLQTENDKKCAFYLAEAALAEAICSLKQEGSGCIGNEQEPAAFGDGYVFTEVFEEEGGVIRVDSYGIQGRARQHLGMVVLKSLKPLAREGFYGKDLLMINSGTVTVVDKQAYLDAQQANADAIAAAKLTDQIVEADSLPVLPGDITPRLGGDGLVLLFGGSGTSATIVEADVRSGPGYSMVLPIGCTILGSTAPRPERAHLPEIKPPVLTSSGDLKINSGNPTTFLQNTRKGKLQVDSGGILTLVGPVKIVFDELLVAGGGLVVVDGSAGPVDLYVLDKYEIKSGAAFDNLYGQASHLRLQVLAADTGSMKYEKFKVGSTAEFIGQIYAPFANISLPSNSIIKGSIASRSLVVGSKSRLEHDPMLMVDGLISTDYESINWKVLKIPESIANPFVYNPGAYYAAAGKSPPDISKAEVVIDEIVRMVSAETGKVVTYRGHLTKLPPRAIGQVLDTVSKFDLLFAKLRVPPGRIDDNIDDDKPPK